ncbi:MAG: stage II sporulation protein M, partial [Balneolaceae bacterium]
VLSSMNDPSFVRFIMGDAYVNMTISNIEQDDPLAVYKKADEMNMFFAITTNNVRVSFYAFASGLLTSIGVALVMLSNGIMVGAFLHFFAKYALLQEAVLVIFIHGTLELSAIVIAGAAGFVVGNGFLFPGTYSRKDSFIKATKQGLKMIIGLVPVFIAAGFLESFVTRYTTMPLWLSLIIILASLVFILYYFVLLPAKINLEK